MKNARSKVVGAKSPANSSASMALRSAAASPKRRSGSESSARRKRSAMGSGRAARSPVVLVTCAPARREAGSVPSGAWPVRASRRSEAEGVDVGSRIARAPGSLLGREVAALLGGQEPRAAQARPQPEALDLHLSVVGHHEPRGREKAVHEGLACVVLPRVQRLEGRGGPARDHERVLRREREGLAPAALEDGGERLPLDELRGDVEGVLHASDAQDPHEARAVDPGGEPRLVHEALRGLGARGDGRAESEHGDEAVEPRRAEPRRPVLHAERARLLGLEEDESSELLPHSHGIGPRGREGR